MKIFDFFRKEIPVNVEEVLHDFFYNYKVLLSEANDKLKELKITSDSIRKTIRLKSVGFENSEEIITDTLTKRSRIKEVIKTINYFKKKYYKTTYLSNISAKILCEKYGLVKSDVKYYGGEVPERCLTAIENLEIDPKDEIYSITFLPKATNFFGNIDCFSNENIVGEKFPLEIIAHFSEFKFSSKFKPNKKKSIVNIRLILKPVYHKNNLHYIIITTW